MPQPAPFLSPIATGSDLLALLRPDDLAMLESRSEQWELATGETVYCPGDQVEHCYFPIGPSLCSYLVELDCGATVETVMVGREGALGGVVSHGSLPSFARLTVLHGGHFLRIGADDLAAVRRQSPAVAALMTRYADCLLAQVFQSIACNAVHTIEQRAARWLTAAVERIGSNDLTMTQEQLAGMMGIGRSYASRVLQRFKRDSLLRTRRGGIEVLDGAALRLRACGCNDRVRQHFALVLGGSWRPGD